MQEQISSVNCLSWPNRFSLGQDVLMDHLICFGEIWEVDITSLIEIVYWKMLSVRDDRTGDTGKKISSLLIFSCLKGDRCSIKNHWLVISGNVLDEEINCNFGHYLTGGMMSDAVFFYQFHCILFSMPNQYFSPELDTGFRIRCMGSNRINTIRQRRDHHLSFWSQIEPLTKGG